MTRDQMIDEINLIEISIKDLANRNIEAMKMCEHYSDDVMQQTRNLADSMIKVIDSSRALQKALSQSVHEVA